MLFLTKRLEKDNFFLKLGLEFQLQLSGHPVNVIVTVANTNWMLEYKCTTV